MQYTEAKGVVKTVENGRSTIRLDHSPEDSCGGSCACSAFSGGSRDIDVPQDEFEEGERVLVRIPRPNPYLSMFFVFVLPLALVMTGLVIGQKMHGEPRLGGPAAAGGAAGLALALVVGWVGNRLLSPKEGPAAERIKSD